jgi:hypothetical protein
MLPLIYQNRLKIGLKTDHFSDSSFEQTYFFDNKLIHVKWNSTLFLLNKLKRMELSSANRNNALWN